MAVSEFREQVGQIGIGFDAIQLVGADQGREACPVSPSLIGSSVMMPGVWILTRLSRIRFTRFAVKWSRLQDLRTAVQKLATEVA